MIVADSDVLIDYLRGIAPAADRIALELERGDLRTTVISRFELLAGARSRRSRRLTEELLAAVPALSLLDDAADRAAVIYRELAEASIGIPMADCLIAGIVVVADGILLTRNRGHFARVKGLHLGSFPTSNSD